MPKITAAAAALLLVLALAGCGDDGATGDTGAEHAKPSAQGASETPAPLVAEDPSDDVDVQFLAEARDRLSGLGSATTIPNATDEQLVMAGRASCDQLAAGTPFNDVTVIEGEKRVQGSYLDSAAIASAGILFFCPELNGKTN